MTDKINEKQDVIIESNSSEIALEDGEIEEEETTVVVEVVETIDVDSQEIGVTESEVVNDSSDFDLPDQVSGKSKKHRHHKKSLHRKRQLSTDEISITDSVKKVRNNDEYHESTPLRDLNLMDNDNYRHMKDKSVEKCTWQNDSDNDDFNNHKFNNQRYTSKSPIREEKLFVENSEKSSPIEEKESSFIGSPVMKEKWGCDSDEDDSKQIDYTQGVAKNDWCNNDDNKNSWANKSDGNIGWNNRNDVNKEWGDKDNDDKVWENKDNDNSGWKNKDNDNKGWANKDDDEKGWGNRNNNNRGWGNRNDSRSDWRNNDDNNNSFGNRRGGRNNWGDRSDDRGNRGFRSRGRGNWRNRNDDDNGGGRNRGRNDWSNNRRDNDSWGNRNEGNNSWDNKDNNSWGNKNDDNNSWNNKKDDNNSWNNKNDENDSWKNKDNDSWKNKQEDKQELKATADNENINTFEVVEKQAWGATSDDEDSPITHVVSKLPKVQLPQESFPGKFENEEISVPAQPRDIDDFGKWGNFDSDEDEKKTKEVKPMAKADNFENTPADTSFNKSSPLLAVKWGYDSDDETGVSKPSTFKPQSNFNDEDNGSAFNRNDSGGNQWSSPNQSKPDQSRNSFSKWGHADSDDENKSKQNDDEGGRGNFNNYNKKSFDQRNNRNNNYNNRGDNYNNRGDNNNNRGDSSNRGRGGGGGGGKRWPCKYFQNGSCRHGDNCNFIHDSPVKAPVESLIQSEPKIYELCRFYEHQECYNRSTCVLMHEEFPCKLFHAGSKMCPSGDSCKYSHAPLNPETRSMLEKYLDEKIDERTDKSTSGSINDNSDYKTNLSLPPPVDEMMHDPYFHDPMQRMFPPVQDMMKMPIRPWNPMMPYGDMPLPPQMDYMQRQRFMFERFPQAMPGRMMPRGFRGMPVPMHDPYNGAPYAVPPMMPVYGNPKGMQDIKEHLNGSDPFLDNLAQMVVGPKESIKRDLDPNDDMDEFSANVENDCKRRSMLSPVKINSPEVPPGAYVPRNSMNAVQPNVRLGSGVPYGGNEAQMMYGGFPGHPNDPAMMDYINMAAIHYYHNQNDSMNYDKPWKLIILDVPGKIPYPLMNIDTQELPHKYIDPRLKGHPSVLNSTLSTEKTMIQRDHSQDFSASGIGSQLSSPMAVNTNCTDMERQLSFPGHYRQDLDSPLFPISEEAFTFLGTDDNAKRVLDRSYLQDPRFKRKKVNAISSLDQTEMTE